MRCVNANNSKRPDAGWYASTKRALDVAGSLVGLALLWPVMLGAGIWVKCVDGGPVFYQQWRVGRGGWLFRIWKLRTMRLDAEHGGKAALASRGDPRILPGCRWLRKAHIDELPQLVNILRGEMSLVGPRPERPEVIDQLRRDLPTIEQRLRVLPGLTGLAQVQNGYANDLPGMRRKLALDLTYTRRASLLRDIGLIVATVRRLWDNAAC